MLQRQKTANSQA